MEKAGQPFRVDIKAGRRTGLFEASPALRGERRSRASCGKPLRPDHVRRLPPRHQRRRAQAGLHEPPGSGVRVAGFKNVRTLLASGNVLFNAPPQNRARLTSRIEVQLKKTLGHEITVILRTRDDLQALADLNPFRRIRVTPLTRLFVTFLSEKPRTRLKTKVSASSASPAARSAPCSPWARNGRRTFVRWTSSRKNSARKSPPAVGAPSSASSAPPP